MMMMILIKLIVEKHNDNDSDTVRVMIMLLTKDKNTILYFSLNDSLLNVVCFILIIKQYLRTCRSNCMIPSEPTPLGYEIKSIHRFRYKHNKGIKLSSWITIRFSDFETKEILDWNWHERKRSPIHVSFSLT